MILSIELEKKLRALKPELSAGFHVDRIGYFGSYARNEQTPDSDIDILVSLSQPLGWAFVDLLELLEKELSVKVDLVSEKALREQMKEQILREVKYV